MYLTYKSNMRKRNGRWGFAARDARNFQKRECTTTRFQCIHSTLLRRARLFSVGETEATPAQGTVIAA